MVKVDFSSVKWSPQQTDFLKWAKYGKGSCVLEAVAGAGKSTTLIAAVGEIEGGVALMAFNRPVARELKEKLEKAGIDWKKGKAGTAHSFGLAAYKKLRPACAQDSWKPNKHKVAELIAEEIKEDHALAAHTDQIAQLISLAKQAAFGVENDDINTRAAWEGLAYHHDIFDEEDSEEIRLEVLRKAVYFLKKSVKQLDVLDFDDMIYMPLFHNARFWQYDVVMIDEAQDTNRARRMLARRMLKRGGRLIAVGDRHQAIYGFTGADADSLDLIAKEFDATRLPLTVSYRCPRKVVEFAQQWVSHIEAHESAPDGIVSSMSFDIFSALTAKDLTAEDAILCRNTAPLVSLAFQMIRRKIPCRIEGRDVCSKLEKMLKRWKVTSFDAYMKKLEKWATNERAKLLVKKEESKLINLEDTVETIKVIIDQCREEGNHTIKEAIEYVAGMFADDVTGMLVLSTIHKAKGREWKRVFWYNRSGTCPSKFAKQKWQQDQEVNLMYVAATRAKHELVELLPMPVGYVATKKMKKRETATA